MSSPLAHQDRAQILDALRGFALFGIIITHVPDFSGYGFMSSVEQAALDRFGVDASLAWLQEFLIRGKFYSLFALLFGIGFAVQLQSAARRDAPFARHFTRRLAILLVIGLAHASLWYGDILKDYALIGLLLIVTARWRLNAVIWAAAGVLALRLAWPFLMAWIAGMATSSEGSLSGSTAGDMFSLLAHTFQGNDLQATFTANLQLLGLKAMQMIYEGKSVSILFMFLLGTLIGRTRLFRELDTHRRLFWSVVIVCAPAGILGNIALVPLDAAATAFPPNEAWLIERTLFAVAVPAMALSYAATFALLWSYGGRRLLQPFTFTGRVALTTYVSQTIILAGLFYGIGLGLWGTIGLTEGTMLAVLVFVAQSALAALWLRFFRFGPLEWVWRRLTYGQPIPFLRRAVPA